MGPQLDSCGRVLKFLGNKLGRTLQWGRNLIVAEGNQNGGPTQFQAKLQWGRNLIVAEGVPWSCKDECQYHASMGPQLDSCGRETVLPDVNIVDLLQWGRNLIVAEGITIYESGLPDWALQWGRNLIVAEGVIRGGPPYILISFNGAAT